MEEYTTYFLHTSKSTLTDEMLLAPFDVHFHGKVHLGNHLALSKVVYNNSLDLKIKTAEI